MTTSDRELAQRIGQRDEAAFEELLFRCEGSVRRRLAAIVRDGAAAEDLFQETFLRLWTRADQWDGRGPLGAWLMRIATNLALNHLRTARRRKEKPLAPPPEVEDEENPVPGWLIDTVTLGPVALLEQAERRRRVRELTDDLSEDKRDVLRMIYDEEMDIEAAAERLQIPQGTVKSRLHYARKQLARKWTQSKGEQT